MLRKIVVPLDGSPFAERALAHLPRLGGPGELEILLVQVIDSVRYYGYAVPETAHVLDFARWREEVQRYLERLANELREQGYQVDTYVADGDVATSICTVATEREADLIAMTTHGRSGLPRWIMGSVADRVLRAARQPVYLVRPGREMLAARAPQRVLVPLDGSALAESALGPAQELVRGTQAEIWLVQAVEMPELWGEEFISAETIASLPSVEEQEEGARAYLESVATSLRTAGHSVHLHVETGHPANVIASVAADRTVDTVVMSTHGRSGLSRWVFGSVAEKVVRLVDCPVLLVRAAHSTPAATGAQVAETGAGD